MSSVYTPNAANNPTSYTQPSDGDNANAASVLAFIQGLADKSAFLGALWKPYVMAYSSTIVTTSLTSGTTATVVQATFPAFTTLTSDVMLVLPVVSLGSGASSGTTYVQGFNGSANTTVDTSSAYGFSAPLTNAAVQFAGSPGAITGLTTVRTQLNVNGPCTVNSARLFVAIFRQG